MKREFPKVRGKKPRCSGCGHLLEQHTKIGACLARREVADGRENNCRCFIANMPKLIAQAKAAIAEARA